MSNRRKRRADHGRDERPRPYILIDGSEDGDGSGPIYRMDVFRTMHSIGAGLIDGDAARLAAVYLIDDIRGQDPTEAAALASAMGYDPLLMAEPTTDVDEFIESCRELVAKDLLRPDGPTLYPGGPVIRQGDLTGPNGLFPRVDPEV